MDKMQMQSASGTSLNIEKIAALFPNCVTETTDKEGNIRKGIDFEKLQEELSDDIIGTGKERYQFTWPDKRQAIHTANTPTTKTLRPCREDSVDFDNTENLYIEGDNLDVLKLLRENYFGKVKMIYIDPPYNTGNDFVYNDNFKMDEDLFSEVSGERDEVGNRMVVNSDSNGRFHTDWLNMMYPRLKVARDLLTEDGVIFISIDDNEIDNLKKICNEIYGESNLVSEIPWQSRASIQNDTDFSVNHEYICVYAKNRRQENRRLKETNASVWYKKDTFVCRPIPLDKSKFDNPDNDPRGPWKADPFDAPHIRPNLTYPIENPNTKEVLFPPEGRHWRIEQKKYELALADNRIVWTKGGLGKPQLKSFYEEKKDFGSVDNSWFSADRIGTSTNGTKELMSLFDGISYFDTPKPTSLLCKLISLSNIGEGEIILDFFSGSSTTADAVIKENALGGNYKFIMVQVPERTEIDSVANKQGFENICEIGKERIRRAAKKIKAEMETEGKDTSKMDFGFRVLKLDSSNMKDVYYTPQETKADLFSDNNVKEDRTAEDLLFQVMPKCDLMLSEKITKENINGKDVYFVKDNYLAACFDNDLTDDVIKEIAKRQPYHFVMKEGGAMKDSVLDNFEQIFKTYSAGTKCMVI